MARGGKRKGAGRRKGIPNKLTADVRRAILGAFDKVGGVDYLVQLAKTDPRTFCSLLGRTIPIKISGDEENPLRVTMTVDRPPDETREEWLARRAKELGVNVAVGSARLM